MEDERNIIITIRTRINKINGTVTRESNKKSILILDSGAHQCTCGGDAWIVLAKTGQSVQCNGYMK